MDQVLQLPEVKGVRVSGFPEIFSRHFHCSDPDTHEMIYVLNGSIVLELEEERRRFEFSGGDLFFVPGGLRHRDCFTVGGELQLLFVQFRFPGYREFFALVRNDGINKVLMPWRAEIRWICEAMGADNGAGEVDLWVEHSRLFHILMIVYRAFSRERQSVEGVASRSRNEAIRKAKAYIEKHYADSAIRLEEIARHLKISPFHLSRIFSAECGFSVSEYVTMVRINRARELLHTGKFRIGEVATMVGYDNGNYFAKVFRRYTGVAPGKFQ